MNKIKKHSITAPEKEEVVKTISANLRQHEEIYAAYLFGSLVNGQSFGDIDLAILLQNEPENLLECELEFEIKLEELVKFSVDVRVINKAPVSFVQNVIRHGKVIIDSKPNIRSDFESYILRKYFDFSSFRRRYLTEVGNAPV